MAYVVGEKYFIRTVAMIYTGKLVEVHDKELVITDAAWIADTGRFAQAVATGCFFEVEPYPDSAQVIIGREAILDALIVKWDLPRDQK